MSAQAVIRQAGEDDVDRIAEIESESLGLWTIGQFRDEISNPQSLFLVAVRDGILAGYIAARKVLDEIEILIIATAREFRRRGIATMLLETLASRLDPGPGGRMYLEVGEKNIAAREFYLRRGFRETGRRRNYYRGESALLLTRDYEDKNS